jgi:hypothetical protein
MGEVARLPLTARVTTLTAEGDLGGEARPAPGDAPHLIGTNLQGAIASLSTVWPDVFDEKAASVITPKN